MGGRLGDRRVPIRVKLAAALAIPLAGLLTVTWLEVRAASAEASRVRSEAALAQASLGPSSITTAVFSERAFAGAYTIGQERSFMLQAESNAEARRATDRAIRQFTTQLERDDDLRATYRPALEALEGLDEVRAAVDRVEDTDRTIGNTEASVIFDDYTTITDALGDAQATVTGSITDEHLRGGAELLELGNRQSDLVARLVRNMLLPAVTGDLALTTPEEIRALAVDMAELDANAGQIRARAAGPYRPIVDELFATDHIRAFPALVEGVIDTGAVDIPAVGPTATGTEPNRFGYVVFRDDLTDQLSAEAADARAAADARLRLFVFLAGAATLVAVTTTVVAAQSITRPLRRLTAEARAMAEHHLPAAVADVLSTPMGDDVAVPALGAISVTSRDEVADVGAALNDVQASALDLAIEQAVLRRNLADALVNLGRRNQNLVTRQLDFITVLERDEADPETLESLFRLDHLATRIRRNAESLLVLAGLETPRSWTAPQRLSDVARSALGEVNDYRRVQATEIAPATVRGTAAVDLAHLLAELLENALRATAPHGRVEVRGRWLRSGSYLLGVVDDGAGMPEPDIERANRRLAGMENFTVAPSTYLGHYVVGHLAARHGIRARIVQSPGRGITALVELPPSLLADGETRVLPPPVDPRAGRAQALMDSA